MADEHDLTCAEVVDDLELHVLGALDPADEARVAAHLDGCAGCRARVDAVTATLGELLGAVPTVDPPDGFVERATSSFATSGTPTRAGPAADRATATPMVRRSRRVLWWGAAAAVVLLVAAGLLVAGSWWASSQRDTGEVAGPATSVPATSVPATSVPAARRAPLVTADGSAIGTVSLTSAGDGLALTMAVDRAPAGVPYDCVVRTVDGTLVTVGSWTTTEAGPASWEVSLDPGIALVEEVSLVVPGTGTVATARPA